jgi:SAM-dependent methyltransferase
MPAPEALEKYYSTYYSRNQLNKVGREVTLGNPSRMGRHLSSISRKSCARRRVKILDFGGGDGTIAVLTGLNLLNHGDVDHVDITVVDFPRNQLDPSEGQIDLKYAQSLDEIVDRQFDFVIASAVIEHVPDAPRLLTQLLSMVRRGGLFYARTPQVKSFVLFAKALHFRWDFTFPAHVYDLGQGFWEKYFAQDCVADRFDVLSSRPSLVEASLCETPLRAVLAYFFKMPWYVLGRNWGFVGGWEIVGRHRPDAK